MKKRRKLSLAAKIAIYISIILLVINLFIGTIFIIRSVSSKKTLLQGKYFEASEAAAALVDGEYIYNATEADKGTDKFNEQLNILRSFITDAKGRFDAPIKYAYTVKDVDKKGETFLFVVDPAEDAEPFTELSSKALTSALLKAAKEHKSTFDSKSYGDKWGRFYSAYAPVIKDGQYTGVIVAVDVDASFYERSITNDAFAIAAVSVVSIAIGVLAALLISYRFRKQFEIISKDMNELQINVHNLLKTSETSPRDEKDNQNVLIEDLNTKDQVAILQNKIKKTKEEVEHYIEYAHRQAFLDGLTHMGNRSSYFDRITKVEENLKEEKSSLVVLVFDINGLKQINDTYGHETGDRSIIAASNILKEIYGKDNCYRIGGDELVIILDDMDENEVIDSMTRFDKQIKAFNKKHEYLPFDLTLLKSAVVKIGAKHVNL